MQHTRNMSRCVDATTQVIRYWDSITVESTQMHPDVDHQPICLGGRLEQLIMVGSLCSATVPTRSRRCSPRNAFLLEDVEMPTKMPRILDHPKVDQGPFLPYFSCLHTP